ncbi:MAG: ABC transporter substrate-binding protein [Alphaproteobacteria bacterium]|nr:ABC transporter substrate-binding protein [Alphaproteobacteria bacterium]
MNIIRSFGLAALAAVALVSTNGESFAQQLTIAGNIPLTGPASSFAGNYFKSLEMGYDEGCKEQGISPCPFKIDAQDNQAKAQEAVTIAQKQLLSNPAVYVSGLSTQSRAVLPEVDKLPIPHLLVAFDSFMAQRGANRVRIMPNYKTEAPMFVAYAKAKGAKRVFGTALSLAAATEQFSALIEPEIKKMGATYQLEQFEVSAKDYNTIALKAKEFNPDVILLNGLAFNVYPLVKAFRTQGLSDKIISCMDFVDLLYNNTPRDDLKNVTFVTPIFELPGGVPTAPDWRKRWEAKNGKQPSFVDAYAYDTGRILAAAYKKGGGKVTVDTIRSVMPFKGVAGEIQLDADKDIIATLGFGRVNDKGEVEAVKLPGM